MKLRATVIERPHIRWLIGRDMDEVLGIDQVSHESQHRWSRSEWAEVLKERDTIGLAVSEEDFGRVYGFAVYRLRKPAIEILKLAVHPLFRRQGLANAMLARIESKITQRDGRDSVRMDVEERALPLQLLLNKRWWRCVTSVGPSHERTLRFVFKSQ